MAFTQGQEKTPGSGRTAGTPNKSTAILREARKTAAEILSGEANPIAGACKLGMIIEGASAAQLERLGNDWGALQPADFERLIEAMNKAAKIYIGLAEFVYPKLARLDNVGEAPQVTVENRFEFVLNTTHAPPAATAAIGSGGNGSSAPAGGNGSDNPSDVPPPVALPEAGSGDL